MKTFLIPQYGIEVIVDKGAGSIHSKLKEHLIGDDPDYLKTQPEDTEEAIDACVNTLESLIMAHACAGIDVASSAYVTGLESCMEALGNNL
jgi:hypothetical protein